MVQDARSNVALHTEQHVIFISLVSCPNLTFIFTFVQTFLYCRASNVGCPVLSCVSQASGALQLITHVD